MQTCFFCSGTNPLPWFIRAIPLPYFFFVFAGQNTVQYSTGNFVFEFNPFQNHTMTKRLTGFQKALILFACFGLAVFGFMLKLPAAFRHMDKELHAAFYFLAAAMLNVLFAGTKLLRHVVIFVGLYLFGVGIEAAQQWSNRFFRRRIHGRFDPEDIAWNLKGLLLFSALWLLIMAALLAYRKLGPKKASLSSKS